MIIIHLPHKRKGEIVLARADLFNNRFRSLICGDKVYEVAKNLNVDHAVPNVFAHVSSMLKGLLKSQADIICANNVRAILKILKKFCWQ